MWEESSERWYALAQCRVALLRWITSCPIRWVRGHRQWHIVKCCKELLYSTNCFVLTGCIADSMLLTAMQLTLLSERDGQDKTSSQVRTHSIIILRDLNQRWPKLWYSNNRKWLFSLSHSQLFFRAFISYFYCTLAECILTSLEVSRFFFFNDSLVWNSHALIVNSKYNFFSLFISPKLQSSLVWLISHKRRLNSSFIKEDTRRFLLISTSL